MTPQIVEIDAYDVLTGSTSTIRVADGPSAEVYGLGGFKWDTGILKRAVMTLEILSIDLSARIQTGQATLTLSRRAMRSVPLTRLIKWNGSPIRIYSADKLSYDRKVTEFVGTIKSFNFNPDTFELQLSCEVSVDYLDKPLLTKEMTGLGGANGTAEKLGTLMPAGFGYCTNIEPVWVDDSRSIGMIDGYGNLISCSAAMEGASLFPASVGNYPTFAALAAAIDNKDIKPGQWGTCYAEGLVGFGAPPVKPIGINARFGFGTSGSLISRVILTHAAAPAALVDAASLAALDTAVPYPIHYWTKDQRNVDDLVQAVARAANATPVVDCQGTFRTIRNVPTASAATLNRSGGTLPRVIGWQTTSPLSPFWQIKMRAERPANVLSYSDVLFENDLTDRGAYLSTEIYRVGDIVTLPNKSKWLYINSNPSKGIAPPNAAYWQNMEAATAYSDGTPIDDLRPAEIGADITSDVTGMTGIAIECDSGGTPLTGELPTNVPYKLFRGSTDVTSSASWTVSVLTGNVTLGIGINSGTLTISAIATDEATARVTATIGTKSRYLDITLYKTKQKSTIQKLQELDEDIAASNQLIADLQADANDLTSRLGTAENTITQQGQDIQSQYSQILLNAQHIATAEQNISANTAQIDELWLAVDDGQGGAIAQLTQRVTTAESNITTLQQSMTTAEGSIATLQQRVQAGNPNLLLNGGFENGLSNWVQAAGTWGVSTVQGNEAVHGTHATCVSFGTNTNGTQLAYIQATLTKITPSTVYSLSGRIRLTGGAGASGYAYFDLIFFDANKNILTPNSVADPGGGATAPVGTEFDSPNNRQNYAYTVTTPSTAYYAMARCVCEQGVGLTQVAFQQVKLERGLPTPYTPEASVSQSFTAINTVSGSVATLSQTVSTQGSSITILQQASTTQEGKLATLTTRLNAAGNPNLLKNGGFENALSGWSPVGGTWDWSGTATTWGTYAYLGLNNTTGSDRWCYLDSELIQVQELTQYTVSGDLWGQGAANLRQYFDLLWYNSGGTNFTSSGTVAIRTGSIPFGNPISGTVTAPAGAYYVRVRPVFHIPAGASVAGLVARMIKFERGPTATAFSSDASIVQSFTVANGAAASVATLTQTVSTQGSAITVAQQSITNLQGTSASLLQRIGTASGNLLGNSEFQVNAAGWGIYAPTGAASMEWLRDGAGDDWRPTGEHNLTIHQTDGDTNKWAQWHVDGPQQPAVTQGTWYEWSVNIAAHRCDIEIKVEWYNSARVAIDTSWSGRRTVGSGGRDLTSWQRIAVKGQAPAGASYAVPCVVKLGTYAGQGDSWMWFVRPMFREVTVDTVVPTPYSPPSGRAVVDNIYSTVSSVNGTLLARAALRLDVNRYVTGYEINNNGEVGSFIIHADYFAIVKPGGGARTEYSDGNWRCYDANNTLRTRNGVWNV